LKTPVLGLLALDVAVKSSIPSTPGIAFGYDVGVPTCSTDRFYEAELKKIVLHIYLVLQKLKHVSLNLKRK
jgi:hypothetical protein